MLFVSIIGDSISTYDGFNPEGYEVYYDKPRQMNNGMSSVYDTWWAKVNQGLHAYLCVNNSFSGSRVTGEGFPAASSTERTSLLHTQWYSPDLILIYIGFNDFGNGVPIRNPEPSCFFRKNPAFFEDAYEIMLKKVKHGYPSARIICATLMRTEVKGREYWDFPEHYRGNAFEDFTPEKLKNVCIEILADKGVDMASYDINAMAMLFGMYYPVSRQKYNAISEKVARLDNTWVLDLKKAS